MADDKKPKLRDQLSEAVDEQTGWANENAQAAHAYKEYHEGLSRRHGKEQVDAREVKDVGLGDSHKEAAESHDRAASSYRLARNAFLGGHGDDAQYYLERAEKRADVAKNNTKQLGFDKWLKED